MLPLLCSRLPCPGFSFCRQNHLGLRRTSPPWPHQQLSERCRKSLPSDQPPAVHAWNAQIFSCNWHCEGMSIFCIPSSHELQSHKLQMGIKMRARDSWTFSPLLVSRIFVFYLLIFSHFISPTYEHNYVANLHLLYPLSTCFCPGNSPMNYSLPTPLIEELRTVGFVRVAFKPRKSMLRTMAEVSNNCWKTKWGHSYLEIKKLVHPY